MHPIPHSPAAEKGPFIRTGPVFVCADDYGVVPNFVAAPQPEPEPVAAPDGEPLVAARDRLIVLEREIELALARRRGEDEKHAVDLWAGRRRVAELRALIGLVIETVARERLPHATRHAALAMPPEGALVALPDLLPAIRAARAVAAALVRRRAVVAGA